MDFKEQATAIFEKFYQNGSLILSVLKVVMIMKLAMRR